MRNDLVWVSAVMIDPALIMPMRNQIEGNVDYTLIDDGHLNSAGDVLGPENFPSNMGY